MSSIHEALTAQFLRWELRGRGWQSFDEPVALEPPFRPFEGHFLPPPVGRTDEARHDSIVSGLLGKLRRAYSPTEAELAQPENEEESNLVLWRRDSTAIELQIALPSERRFPRERFESFFLMLGGCEDPLAFEIMATEREIVFQFVASEADAALVRRQIEMHFGGLVVVTSESALAEAWREAGGAMEVAEFGLTREFMLPLGMPKADIFLGLMAGLSAVGTDELLLYQVVFEPARSPWAASALAAVSDGDGGPFFSNRPELLPEARLKLLRPLFAVTLKIGACAETHDRAWELLAPLVAGMGVVERPGGNRLVPLAPNGTSPRALEDDLLNRHSHRLGMLLNLDELITFAHLPDDSVRAPRLRVDSGRTRSAPMDLASGGLFLGWNEHAGQQQPVSLSLEQRVRHVHLVGASGTGKSTLLFNLIRDDLIRGEGLTVIDPHGDLIDAVLGAIPADRTNDVVLIDPSDENFSVGFNVLAAQGDMEKNLLASDLVSIFQRLSTSWGDQMASVLNYAILAFLESREGGTLADLQRFLLEPEYQARFLTTVEDDQVVYYWKKGFLKLGGNKSIGPLLTRLGLFLSPRPIRYMVAQRENRLDFGALMAAGKIILARLPQGRMGKENAFLLGSLLVSKIQQAAMARQRVPEAQRRLHTLYVDEFQEFCTPSMAEILTGARKYRVALVLAHQSLDQIKRHDAVGSAVLANAGTRVVFRVSDADARELERGFAHFDAEVLQSLGEGRAIVRIGRSDADFNLTIPLPQPVPLMEAAAVREAVVAASRHNYGKSRSEVERELQNGVAQVPRPPEPPRPSPAARSEEIEIEPPAVAISPTKAPEPPTPPPASPAPLPTAPVAPYTPTSLRPSIDALGRGGLEHQAAQAELKQVAEALGFRASVEHQVPGSQEAADLYLEREGIAIACEISVTNTLEAEVRNVTKHLRAGVPHVAVVCLTAEKLSKLKAAVTNALPPSQTSKVDFFLKEDFVQHLQSLAIAPPKAAGQREPKKTKGWKVTTSTEETSPEETKRRENEIAALLAAAMSRKTSVRKSAKKRQWKEPPA